MHYYQHHIGDFIRNTSRLTDSQCMAYIRMIWLYYESESPLPDNARIIALKIGSDETSVSLMLEAFFKKSGDLWHHKRCDAEIKEYRSIRERNRENGKAGGRPKKTQWVSSGLPVETDTEPRRNPNQEPITNNQQPVKTKDIRAPRFDAQAHLQSLGVPNVVARDWITLRKSKRSAVTLTAIEGVERECTKAGITLTAALKVCCERGWQGFKAEWLQPDQRGSPSVTREDSRRIAAGTMLSDFINDDGTPKNGTDGNTITGTARLLG